MRKRAIMLARKIQSKFLPWSEKSRTVVIPDLSKLIEILHSGFVTDDIYQKINQALINNTDLDNWLADGGSLNGKYLTAPILTSQWIEYCWTRIDRLKRKLRGDQDNKIKNKEGSKPESKSTGKLGGVLKEQLNHESKATFNLSDKVAVICRDPGLDNDQLKHLIKLLENDKIDEKEIDRAYQMSSGRIKVHHKVESKRSVYESVEEEAFVSLLRQVFYDAGSDGDFTEKLFLLSHQEKLNALSLHQLLLDEYIPMLEEIKHKDRTNDVVGSIKILLTSPVMTDRNRHSLFKGLRWGNIDSYLKRISHDVIKHQFFQALKEYKSEHADINPMIAYLLKNTQLVRQSFFRDSAVLKEKVLMDKKVREIYDNFWIETLYKSQPNSPAKASLEQITHVFSSPFLQPEGRSELLKLAEQRRLNNTAVSKVQEIIYRIVLTRVYDYDTDLGLALRKVFYAKKRNLIEIRVIISQVAGGQWSELLRESMDSPRFAHSPSVKELSHLGAFKPPNAQKPEVSSLSESKTLNK